jgi:hypothetical protein
MVKGGVVSDRDGNVIALLLVRDDRGSLSQVLAKVDSWGRLLWQHPARREASGRSVAVTPDGAIYVASYDGVVSKYGPDGSFWYSINVAAGYNIAAIAADARGGFALIIYQPVFGEISQRATFIDRRNPEGEIMWGHILVSSGEIRAYNLVFDPAGDILVGGEIINYAQFEERGQPPVRGTWGCGTASCGTPYLAKVSGADGWVTWVQTTDGTSDSTAQIVDIGTTAVGTAVGLGTVYKGTVTYAGSSLTTTSQPGFASFLMVAEHDGAARFLRETSRTLARALAVDPAGDAYAVTGYANPYVCDTIVQRWHLTGDLLWRRAFHCSPTFSLDWAAFSPQGWPVFGGQFSDTMDFGTGPQRAQSRWHDAVLLRLEP